jgi:RNA-directed DNA polymerase
MGEQLIEEVCERENCKQALARVKANKGSAGVDGMTVHELPEFLKQHRPAVREQLLSGTYKPQPVRRLSNIVLDELDRELERRGLHFARYADHSNIYVRSRRAGERVMESLTRFITAKLKLQVNQQKSAVTRKGQGSS